MGWKGFEKLPQVQEQLRRESKSAGSLLPEAGMDLLVRAVDPEVRMNKTEAEHALALDHDPDVATWFYECIGLRLGDGCFYYPDFFVILKSGMIRIDEVKGGRIEDDGMAKYKAARERYWFFAWRMVQKTKNGWIVLHEHPKTRRKK